MILFLFYFFRMQLKVFALGGNKQRIVVVLLVPWIGFYEFFDDESITQNVVVVDAIDIFVVLIICPVTLTPSLTSGIGASIIHSSFNHHGRILFRCRFRVCGHANYCILQCGHLNFVPDDERTNIHIRETPFRNGPECKNDKLFKPRRCFFH